MTDEARFKKKNWRPETGPNEPKSGPKLVFLPFSQVYSLVFLEIMYNDSLQQSITLGKAHNKIGSLNLGQNGPKSGPTLVFRHFLKFGSLVFLEITYNNSLQQCIKKNFGPNLGQNGPNSGPKFVLLPFSQVWFISFL